MFVKHQRTINPQQVLLKRILGDLGHKSQRYGFDLFNGSGRFTRAQVDDTSAPDRHVRWDPSLKV
jgi:hypothetical protein